MEWIICRIQEVSKAIIQVINIKNGYKIIKKSHKLMDVIQHYLMEKEI